MQWTEFIKGIADDAGRLAKDQLIDLVSSAAEDQEEFLRKQGKKMQRYLQQLADGEITKKEFEGYMLDLRDLVRIRALKLSVAAQVRAQRIADGIQDLVLDRLLSLL